MSATVCVLGSIDMDLVVEVSRFPREGETVEGVSLAHVPGGKGVNQAVAVANMGVAVDLIGALGDDAFAGTLRESLSRSGVGVETVATVTGSSGVEVVTVDAEGHNRIVRQHLGREAPVEEGRILCTVDQHAGELAVFGIEHALEMLENGATPSDRETPVDLVTADSLR